VHADRIAPNHHRFLDRRTRAYRDTAARSLFSDLLKHERDDGARIIGRTGSWEWLAAFAPEGFYEIWGILPGRTSLLALDAGEWGSLAEGVVNAQRFYRSLCRNGYNFGLLAVEQEDSALELRAVMLVRSNYAAWVRNDHTSFETMLGDMATFHAPEETARLARPFWR
jgi:galactose-1-phosphate uridylyltransferase